ncbi:MAG: toll/interleukin-1 receptor domain-containing protein, partial [Burkholderiales bacterium]|nr:toll/interleukin-1 receptor domain-containing protein [Burkholderiales bacterium]
QATVQKSNKDQKNLKKQLEKQIIITGDGQEGKKHRQRKILHVEREISSEIRSQLRMLKEFGKPEIEFGDRSNDFDQSDSYDLFISHASEDKDEFVRPLATALIALGMRVWYDEFALTIGDSLRESIDLGLSKSAYGLVILSPSFLAKHWTKYEFNGFVSREMEGAKVILPIWHRITKEEVLRFSPTLVDKVALNSANLGIGEIAAELNAAVRKKRRQCK